MRIAVLGDTMIDADIACEIVKWYDVSPVLRELSRVERPGGASNVAEMCRALGADVLLLGPCDPQRTQTIKRRFLVDGKLIARHDTETTEPFVWTIAQRRALTAFNPQVIIVCDHGKGFVTREMLDELPPLPTFIDPIALTPAVNGDHVTWVGGRLEIPDGATGRRIIKHGPGGLSFWDHTGLAGQLPSACRDCVDDIGAGDQFLASLAVLRCSGVEWPDAIEQANDDAGEQCRRFGIQPVTRGQA